MCGCLSADLDEWEEDGIEEHRGMNFPTFANVLKRLQDNCKEISGLGAFQESPLAAVVPSDFSAISVDSKSAQAAQQRRGESRASVTPHSRGSKDSVKEDNKSRNAAGDLRSIEASKYNCPSVAEICHFNIHRCSIAVL